MSFRRITRIPVHALALGFLATFAGQSKAGFIVDQSNAGSVTGFITIDASPIGQEFVPTIGSLDVVELYLHHFFAGDGLSNQVEVTIRSGSITGPILGTSQVVTVGDFGQEGIVDFQFPSTISLNPGSLYVIQLVDLNGPGNVEGLGTTQFAAYSDGQAIYDGIPDPTRDFYFEEGPSSLPPPTVPEPSSWILGAMGAASISALAWRKRNRRMCKME